MAEAVTAKTEIPRHSSKALLLPFAFLTVWAAVTAYCLIFSQFAPYDDEGYLMITFRNFQNGSALYDQVFTQYGPAIYAFKWLLHSVSGLPVTHEGTRFISLLLWILTALVSGLSVWRVTRSVWMSVIGYGSVFLCLSRLTFEPGHPQDFCGLLIALIVLATTHVEPGRRIAAPLAIIGSLLALLALTKLNLAIFVAVATGFCCFRFGTEIKLNRFGSIAFAAAAALLPAVLFYRHFDLGWLGFSVIVWAGLFGAFTALHRTEHARFIGLKNQITITGSFAACVAAVLIFTIASGTSSNELLNGVFLQNLRFANLFFLTAPTHVVAPYWSPVSIAAALYFAIAARSKSPRSNVILDLIRLGFGLATVGAALLAFFAPIYTHLILSFAVPFAWLVMFGRNESTSFARTFLALAPLLLAMQIFPIWGSQMAFASHLPLLCSVIVLSDAIESIRANNRLRFKHVEITITAVACVVFVSATVYAITRYNSLEKLDLPGTGSMRVPNDTAANLKNVTAKVRASCSMLFSMPGMFSFNFWSGSETPTTNNATAWMTLLDDDRQSEIIRSLESAEKPCVIYHPKLAQDALRSVQLPDVPLARYILDNFAETSRHGEYIFLEKSAR